MWYFRRILLNKILLKIVQLYVFHYHFPPSRRVEICMALFFRANGDNFLFAIYTWELHNSSQHVRDQFEYERNQFFYSGVVYMNPDWVSISNDTSNSIRVYMEIEFSWGLKDHGQWKSHSGFKFVSDSCTNNLIFLAILALIHLNTWTKLPILQTIFISAIMNVDFIPSSFKSEISIQVYMIPNRYFIPDTVKEWTVEHSIEFCVPAHFALRTLAFSQPVNCVFWPIETLNWLVEASKLHKHKGTCYTAEWPYCPFATLWFRIECSIRNEKWNELDPELVATQSGFM